MNIKTRLALVACVSFLLAGSSLARELSFADRVHAQEAIERVYYSHQIGATDPFEVAVPATVIEKKVRATLEESAALERILGTPVTDEDLAVELRRITLATRMPDRLQEIYAALGNDPFVIQECLVRPILVDRTLRRLLDPGASGALEESVLDAAPEARWVHTAVWTGTLMIVWGGDGLGPLDTGGRYDPATDSWSPTSTVGAPERRSAHSAVWTGARMVVWGGANLDHPYPDWWRDTGALYDPVADTWTPTSTVGAPSPRSAHSAAWTGNQMIVWGGSNQLGTQTDGARYRPDTDTWTPMSSVNAPSRRFWHSALWTGKQLIVWGGLDDNGFLGTGARYEPATDTWTPTSMVGAPVPRYGHSAVWAGKVMVIWGGSGLEFPYELATGGRYDPETDTWTPTTTTGASTARIGHHAVAMSQRQMIVWGGRDSSFRNKRFNAGAIYDAVLDRWKGMTRRDAPQGRIDFTMVWTGSTAIVWGGANQDGPTQLLNTGGIYDPVTNSWTPTAVLNEEDGE